VRVSLVTAPDLSPASADMVASESGLEESGATWVVVVLVAGGKTGMDRRGRVP
jgi:hypothetical protein